MLKSCVILLPLRGCGLLSAIRGFIPGYASLAAVRHRQRNAPK
jgi:hypothetical protein